MTQFPVIHLAGTSGRVLNREYEAAILALARAVEAMRQITVHGRDYYPIAGHPGAINRALDEHRARIAQLERVLAELYLIHDDIQRQRAGRGERIEED